MQTFNKTVNVSEIEWLLVQKFRRLIANEYGSMIVAKVHKGKVTDFEQEIDIRLSLKEDVNSLMEMQK